LQELQAAPRRGVFASAWQARQAGQRLLEQHQVQGWLRVQTDEQLEEVYRQSGPGRPGPNTLYERDEIRQYRIRFEEDGPALAREARCDGLFPLMSNDEGLSLEEALGKYKYQPFVEKRHEQLKSVFAVAPMWLKSVK